MLDKIIFNGKIILVAYIISRIVMSVANIKGVNFSEFKFSDLIIDLLIWCIAWVISYIIFTRINKRET